MQRPFSKLWIEKYHGDPGDPGDPNIGGLDLKELAIAPAPTVKAPAELAKHKEGQLATPERGDVHAHYECASVCWVKNDHGPENIVLVPELGLYLCAFCHCNSPIIS